MSYEVATLWGRAKALWARFASRKKHCSLTLFPKAPNGASPYLITPSPKAYDYTYHRPQLR